MLAASEGPAGPAGLGFGGHETGRMSRFRGATANGERGERVGERVSLTRAVGDSGQSTSRLCHFRLIPVLRLIFVFLRRVRPFNMRPIAPDSLFRSPISAKSAENALRTSPSTHSRQTADPRTCNVAEVASRGLVLASPASPPSPLLLLLHPELLVQQGEAVLGQTQVCRRARPSVLFRPFHQRRPDRVALDIGQRRHRWVGDSAQQ